jgi:hypothetical protein
VCGYEANWVQKRSADAATLVGVLAAQAAANTAVAINDTLLSSFVGLFFGSKPVLCWLEASCWYQWVVGA